MLHCDGAPRGAVVEALVVKKEKAVKPGRIISVAHVKGGSGKTVTAILICAMLAEMGLNPILLDTDLKSGQGSKYLKKRKAKLEADPELSEEFQEILYIGTRTKKHMVETAFANAKDGHWVVIDALPQSSDIFTAALTISHLAVHPMRQGRTELDSFGTLLDLLAMIGDIRKTNGLTRLKSRSLVTDFRPTKTGRLITDYLYNIPGMPFLGEMAHSEKFEEAIIQGFAIWELFPNHPHIHTIRRVISDAIET